MGIYNINGNNYELVLEERQDKITQGERALYIDLVDVESKQGIDGTFIFPGRIDTQAEECYVPNEGKFTIWPFGYWTEPDVQERLTATEWAVESSDQHVDVLVEELLKRFIYSNNQDEPEEIDELEGEIRAFLDHHILRVYREAANKVINANDCINQ